MKRLLLNLLCLLFAYPCFAAEPIQLARMNPWIAGAVATSTPSCTTSNDSELVSLTDDTINATITETTWKAQGFTITSGTTITTWFLHSSNGLCTGNITCSLYSAGADNKPGTEISGTSVSSSCSGVGNDTDIWFNLATPTVVNDTVVHIVCRMAMGGGTDYLRASSSSVYAGGMENSSSNSGASWSNVPTGDLHISLYGCAP